MHWPKTLHHLRYDVYLNARGERPSLAMLESLLSIQKEGLKTIDLNNNDPRPGLKIANVSDFPHLEVLKLSRCLFSKDLVFSDEEAARLLAPCLKVFEWHFGFPLETQTMDGFGNKEETWLKQFGTFAAGRKSSLRKIKVAFTPTMIGRFECETYPWDRLDWAKEHLSRLGIELEYNPPVIVKEDWDEHRKRASLIEDPPFDDE